MESSIYVDVLFAENFIIQLIIFRLTAFIANVRLSNKKNVLLSIVMAIITIVIYIFPSMLMSNNLIKIIISIGFLYFGFRPTKLKEFFKITAIFYIICFILGGAGYGLGFFMQGLAFIDMSSFIILMISIVLAIGSSFFLWEILVKRMKKEKIIANIDIVINRELIETVGLIDTGNSLREPIWQRPVIVVDSEIISNALEGIEESNFIIIPYKTIDGTHIMRGVIADMVHIRLDSERYSIPRVVIGISEEKISDIEGYKALINPEILNQNRMESKK